MPWQKHRSEYEGGLIKPPLFVKTLTYLKADWFSPQLPAWEFQEGE